MKNLSQAGKWIFGSTFAVFGLLHFGPLEYSLPYVPDFMPWPALWVYFSGAGLIAFTLSVWTGRLDKLAAFLLAAMMLLFVLMIHLPRAIQGDFVQFIGIFRDTAISGASLMYANHFARDLSLVEAL